MATGTGAEAVPGGSGQSFAEAHQAMLADRTLQFQFTDFKPPEPPEWLGPFGRWLASLAPYLQYVFWGGVLVLAALVLFVVGREALRRLPRRKKKDEGAAEPEVVDVRPTHVQARALLEEADRLAREGKYSEAARVLLHRSIEDVQRNFPVAISVAMTSREISQLERMSARAREVFSRIAQAVELSLFGERALNAAQYQECRQIYESFAFDGGKR
ncbi:MAG: hypothetical protein WDM79_07015 [Terricaulis sp.]